LLADFRAFVRSLIFLPFPFLDYLSVGHGWMIAGLSEISSYLDDGVTTLRGPSRQTQGRFLELPHWPASSLVTRTVRRETGCRRRTSWGLSANRPSTTDGSMASSRPAQSNTLARLNL
jgi:hypothetical protein